MSLTMAGNHTEQYIYFDAFMNITVYFVEQIHPLFEYMIQFFPLLSVKLLFFVIL